MPKALKEFQLYNRRVAEGEEFEIPIGENIEEWYANGLIDRPEGDKGPAAQPDVLTTTNNGTVPEGNLPPPLPVGTVANAGTATNQPVVVAKEGDAPPAKPEAQPAPAGTSPAADPGKAVAPQPGAQGGNPEGHE